MRHVMCIHPAAAIELRKDEMDVKLQPDGQLIETLRWQRQALLR